MENNHPEYENCEDDECIECGERDCPFGEPLHYHHDGCPACVIESKYEYCTLDKERYKNKEYKFQNENKIM